MKRLERDDLERRELLFHLPNFLFISREKKNFVDIEVSIFLFLSFSLFFIFLNFFSSSYSFSMAGRDYSRPRRVPRRRRRLLPLGVAAAAQDVCALLGLLAAQRGGASDAHIQGRKLTSDEPTIFFSFFFPSFFSFLFFLVFL